MYQRPVYNLLAQRIDEPRRFIQALVGPRQTGKTTLARQLLDKTDITTQYAAADEPVLKDSTWVEQQWEALRLKMQSSEADKKGLLILDEIQKISGWSETVKRLWDEDSAAGRMIHVIVLGSSPLLMQRGLTESLAGRFEIVPVTHWSFAEIKKAFGWTLNQYIFYGGYPGAASLVEDYDRWRQYITGSLIETTVSRDILLMTRVDKPALLRRLFELGCIYSGQVLSYQKMLGQLQDAGNTTTLAHYLELLQGAGLLTGLQKYSGKRVRQRGSSPKLQVFNTALMSALSLKMPQEAREQTDHWGRLVESAIGASLINGIRGTDLQLFYWSQGNREVDFVLCRGDHIVAIEVKSGRRRVHLNGLDEFSKKFKVSKKLLIGAQGIPLEDFFLTPPRDLIN